MVGVFECFENMNQYQEEVKFPDDATDEDIEKEYEQWVWDQIRDQFGWHKK